MIPVIHLEPAPAVISFRSFHRLPGELFKLLDAVMKSFATTATMVVMHPHFLSHFGCRTIVAGRNELNLACVNFEDFPSHRYNRPGAPPVFFLRGPRDTQADTDCRR